MSPDRPVIGIDVTSAMNQGGGIGRYTRELVRALLEKGDNGFTYRLFSARPPAGANPLPAGANTSYHPTFLSEQWLYRLWYRLRLPVPVQWFTGRVALYHSPDFALPPVAGSIPTILTVHDLSFVHYPETFTPALIAYLNRVGPWSVRRASHILADSQATKDDLINLWQVPAGKITVLYSGVGEMFRPVTDKTELATIRQKYGLDQTPYLFSVSTLQPRKNYQMLIRAFKAIAVNWPHQLVIAGGKGWLYEQILEEVNQQGLTGRVHFLGFVEDKDLPALYSQATLFLFPSLYEGFGLPPLEAMACGVPVVLSNASCLPEVGGQAALLLSPHDPAGWQNAIHRLLLDTDRRTKMIAAGYRQARQFRWAKAANQLRQLYQKLLSYEL